MLALPIDFKRLTFKNLKTLRLFSHLTVFLFFSFFNTLISQELDVQAGKKLFNANCAACHKLNKKAVGPALKESQQNMIENGYIAGLKIVLK